MAKRKWRESDLLVVDDTVFVLFEIEGYDTKVRIHKSLLIENSTFFKDLFDANGGESSNQIVDDKDIGQDLLESFKLFVDSLYRGTIDNIFQGRRGQGVGSCPEIIELYQVYFFARKYGIRWLTDDCFEKCQQRIRFFVYRDRALNSTYIKDLHKVLEEMGFGMERFKKQIKWMCDEDDVIPAFAYATDLGINHLKDQVVAYSCQLEFDPSWPQELTNLVVKRLLGLCDKSNSRFRGCLTDDQLLDVFS